MPLERLQCFEGITPAHAIGKFDESLQRLYLELATRNATPDWKALAKEISSLDFFIAGPLLRAVLSNDPQAQATTQPCGSRCVDECDLASIDFDRSTTVRAAALRDDSERRRRPLRR